MKVVFTSQASAVLESIAVFVESYNTPGSGSRYVAKFIIAVEQMAQANLKYALCRHYEFARLNYGCRNYNDWVVVFTIKGNEFYGF